MSNIVVDTEKLAFGLKIGIAETDTIFADGPSEYMLRFSPCGLVSSAIFQYCQRQGIPAELKISNPNLSFAPSLQHVIPVMGELKRDGTIVDASYSQFLGYVGLHWGYEVTSESKAFPEEEVIDFRISEREVVTDWLTTVAALFQNRNKRPRGVFDLDQGDGPLVVAGKDSLADVFSRIWDPANFKKWHPSARVLHDGRVIAKYIERGAIS